MAWQRNYVSLKSGERIRYALFQRPADIGERHAGDFKKKYANGKFTRKRKLKEGEAAPAYARKGKSLDSRLRTLKAVFEHFRTMSPPLVDANPFAGVELPKLDRVVKYVTRDDVTGFFDWLEERFPGWAMPKLFFRVKAITACRLDDLCSLRAECVRDGGIVFPADLTKQRKEWFAKLPA